MEAITLMRNGKENAILDTIDDVLGELYAVTNTVTGEQYIGQTRTHRLNNGKYRPFGYASRFKHHLSESKYNKETKLKGYLQTAIAKYGADAFKVRCLRVCPLGELDKWETHYIAELQTTYPKGYNLTGGGRKGAQRIESSFQLDHETIVRAEEGWRNVERADETKELISKSTKKSLESAEARKARADQARDQHMQARLALFAPVVHLVPAGADLSKYIKLRRRKTDNSIVFAHVTIGDKTTRFHATATSPDVDVQALQFLRTLIPRTTPSAATTATTVAAPL